MKKLFLSLSCMFTLLLTGCSLFHPTPKLVKQYDNLSFKYTEASHEDWSRHYINEEWEYSEGFYSNGKRGDYFHLYKNEELVYSYEPEDSLIVDEVLYKDNKVYFALTTLNFQSGKEMYKVSINYIDEELNYKKIYEIENTSLDHFNFGDSIFFVSTTRDEQRKTSIVEINYSGEEINQFELGLSSGHLSDLVLTDNNELLVITNTGIYNFYLYTKSGELIKKVCSLPDIYIKSINYNNDELYVLGYQTTYVDFDLSKFTIYEYKNNKLSTLFDIDLPDDYGYTNCSLEEYKNNIYISFSVCEKNAAMSLYSRHIILKCNKIDNSIKVLYENMHLSHNVYYNYGHIYLGNYRNDCYVNNEGSGEFFDIDLNQFDE